MKKDTGLLDVLACPSCKGRLQYASDEKLLCDACRLVFDVKDGVPVLLVEEAEPAD